jgi:beta-galactosidase/beta-glucuronidase
MTKPGQASAPTFTSSDHLDASRRGYPRPQLRRDHWISLNGEWDFAIDHGSAHDGPDAVVWNARILVPFAPEAPASEVGDTGFYRACWYRRRCQWQPLGVGQRRLLHFGAIDYTATVWIDGILSGSHEGGYTPFTIDITSFARGGDCEIVVLAEDDPHDLAKPRGKQDWQLEPHAIWYPRTTGIWQTVWLEDVPETWIDRVAYTADLARWEVGLEVWLTGQRRDDLRLRAALHAGGTIIASDEYLVINDEVHRRIALSDPGIDDSRNALLWSPEAPTLIDVELTLIDGAGVVTDHVCSYTAIRSATVQADRFLLNSRPYTLRMVLDQGYWPDGGLTAPSDEALRRDVVLAKQLGFNGVRKHQKLEDPRYLHWCDRLGLLVWAEMPSAYRFTRDSVGRLSREWMAAIARDYSHPCIIAWVPINESWGVPNLPDNPRERHYVQALYHLTKTLDPTRPVIGNDGWESVATDIIGIHDYDEQPERLARRYGADEILPRLLKRERPGGRQLVLAGHQSDVPLMLTEFGGIALASPDDSTQWGYATVATPQAFIEQYERLLEVVRRLDSLSGFCYTQFADTYQEANGLLYADRTPKVAASRIASATAGHVSARFDGLEQLESTRDEDRRP